MTISGGRAGYWADGASGVRNSRAAVADPLVVLPHLGEKLELTGHHAEGATCDVYKAHHVALDIGVAVKILRPEFAGDPHYLERMRIEAQVLPRLRSRHIVQCFDRGLTDDGRPYTVLEFLRGETLEELVAKLGSFDEATTAEIGAELLAALEVTHRRGIVHRDVTLRNLIVHHTELEPPTLKLIDFGFACILPSAPESAPEPAENPDRDSAIGTPRFTAPEIALGHLHIDGRANLYSTGVVLYTLLAGRDPFAELRTSEAVLEAQAYRPPPPLSRYAPRVSKELERVILRLLEKDRASRYPTAKQAAQALMEAVSVARSQPPKAHSVPPSSTNARPALDVGERCEAYVERILSGHGTATSTGASNAPSRRPRGPRRLVSRRIGSLLLLRQNSSDPSDEEWDECLRLLDSGLTAHGHMKVLVKSDGGGPTRRQRERLHRITPKGNVSVAVVSESAKLRFIVSAVAFLRTRVRSFRSNELEAAFSHLELDPMQRGIAAENLTKMGVLLRELEPERPSKARS